MGERGGRGGMRGLLSIYKNVQKFYIGNFRLGRARSICHKFHSRELRDAWPQKVCPTGDKNIIKTRNL